MNWDGDIQRRQGNALPRPPRRDHWIQLGLVSQAARSGSFQRATSRDMVACRIRHEREY
jgi:hypothetical protein